MATPGLSVWIVDDDESVRWVLEQALKQAHMIPRAFESGHQFFGALERDRPDVLITDIRMPDMSGLELMERLGQQDPDIPVIVITAHSDLDSAVSAYQGGAFEYLPKPFDIDEAVELVSRAARTRHRDTAQQTTTTVAGITLTGTSYATTPTLQYLITTSPSKPTAATTGWASSLTSFTFATQPAAGTSVNLYAWALDSSGNVSVSPKSATVQY